MTEPAAAPTPEQGGAPQGEAPADLSPDQLRTGAETPVDPEDLAMAHGEDPTPEAIERYRQQLADEGAAAVEKAVP